MEISKMQELNTQEGREGIKNMLHNKNLTIFFTKKDGTERKMLCTLSENKIPSEKSPKNTRKAKSDESLAVFDIEKQDWRSFRWDSVKKIEFEV